MTDQWASHLVAGEGLMMTESLRMTWCNNINAVCSMAACRSCFLL